MRFPFRFARPLALCTLAATIVAACSADETFHDEDWNGAGGSFGTTTTTGYGTTSATTGVGTGVGGGVGPAPVAPPDPEPEPVPECAQLDQTKPLVLYLSSDDSNSMASAAIAREAMSWGGPMGIRTHELLNYYRIGYPAPTTDALSIIPQMEPTPGEAGYFDLQIGIRSYDAVLPRRPMTLTFVLDTSGSMGGQPIARERAVVKAIAKNLSDGDIVNMVTWSTSQNVILSGHIVSGPNDPALLAAATDLTSSGGTNLEAGLNVGYQLAVQHYGAGRLNRVILVSDGGANAGVTEAALIAQHSEDADKEGIYLVGVGTGPWDNYHDGLMDVVTDKGRGAYVYLDSELEADRIFGDRFDEVMEVAARAVEVELTLPWYFQMHEFSGEEFSENPEDIEPQHLAPSDSMVFHQVLKACDPSVVNTSDEITIAIEWTEPLTYAPHSLSVTSTLQALLDGDKGHLHKGKAIVAYGKAIASAKPADLAAAYAAAENAGIQGDPELEEIAALLLSHPQFPQSP